MCSFPTLLTLWLWVVLVVVVVVRSVFFPLRVSALICKGKALGHWM